MFFLFEITGRVIVISFVCVTSYQIQRQLNALWYDVIAFKLWILFIIFHSFFFQNLAFILPLYRFIRYFIIQRFCFVYLLFQFIDLFMLSGKLLGISKIANEER